MVLIVLVGVIGNQLGMFSVGNEYGWIPMTEVNDQFTDANYFRTPVAGNAAWYFDTFTSKYWEITTDNEVALSPEPSGGDGEIKIIVQCSFGSDCLAQIKFNEDILNKNFKIDYESQGGTYCPTGAGSCKNIGGSINFLPQFNTNSYDLNSKGTIELKPSLLDKDEVEFIVNGQSLGMITPVENFNLNMIARGRTDGSWIKLSNPRYKPLFDCFVDNDEVAIFDEFAGGSSFDINDLTYSVKKFCPDTYPTVVRSFTERGASSSASFTILNKLASGGTINVPEDKTIRVGYITQSQAGLLRCSLDEAFNVQSGECENMLSEGVPDNLETIIRAVEVGENEVSKMTTTTDSILIGNLNLKTYSQDFVCECTGNQQVGQPKDSCWETTIGNKKVTSKQTLKVNDFVSIYYEAFGSGIDKYCKLIENDGVADKWINFYKVIINKDGLKIYPEETISKEKLNEDKKIKVKIENNIASFNMAGVKIVYKNKILDIYTYEDYSLRLNKGDNIKEIPLKTDMLGDVIIGIRPYVVIEEKKIYSDDNLLINYVVEEDSVEQEVDNSYFDSDSQEDYSEVLPSVNLGNSLGNFINNNILIILIIGGALFVVIIIKR